MTTVVYKYRIYCATESKWKYTWNTSPPTECPINAGHTIHINSISREDKIMISSITASMSPYQLAINSIFCDTSGGTITVNLPNANKLFEKHYLIKKTSSNNVIEINSSTPDLVDGGTTKLLLNNNDYFVLESNGTNWNSLDTKNIPILKNEIKTLENIISKNKGDMFIYNGTDIVSCPAGTNNQMLVSYPNSDCGVSWINRTMYVRIWDEKPTGTNGGSYDKNDGWVKRDLNMSSGNLDITLSNNQFTHIYNFF